MPHWAGRWWRTRSARSIPLPALTASDAAVRAADCLKAIELIPIGDARDTTEVFFYYRGLMSGWAGTLATRAAAIQLGSDSFEKAHRAPPPCPGCYV